MEKITMFSGLSAFPLTPLDEGAIDENAFIQLIERLVDASVDSISVLGSTGSYAYFTSSERTRIAQIAVQHAAHIPVIVGIGALRTRDVLELADAAQQAGASGLLLPPISYQRLSEDEVFDLYATVAQAVSVPICVYDNPTTTHFDFSDALLGRIAQLPQIGSIKIPALPSALDSARTRVERLRASIPQHMTIGVSGDWAAATGLNAGCEAWYSVIGGLFPRVALAIVNAARAKDASGATQLSEQLEPLWTLYREYGSLRVIATAAELRGLVVGPSLPLPIRPLEGSVRQRLNQILDTLQLS